ncbi:MAG: FAD-dependent oxidoreductase [Deltaproteobacteria bacterium]|nr:FAD-dependent oxidoreductase [Deltaproteobacteria bacterium]MCB9478248.1 FAD-dependent oxidoreductase [Deltaproteobacteria bacterium]MCB9487199.1 FAD-dependent oxidoreductase [Deltaproteobacteria bacterium]
MSTPDKPRYVILGGGVAGLTCADALAHRGHEVTVLEALPEVGGLARNIDVDGFLFDIGGHRFFTDKPYIIEWLETLMGDELLTVERKSRILLGGKFHHYPLKPVNALFGMGLARSFAIILGYLKTALFERGGRQDNFEEWVVARFGRPLYDIYFGPYTAKAWGVEPTRISADWAAQRIQLLSLTDAVRKALMNFGPNSPRTYASRFWYPKRGIGRIPVKLAERVRERGGRILLQSPAVKLERENGIYRVTTSQGETIEAERIISTIPVPILCRLLGDEGMNGALEYRCLRCVFLKIDRPRVTDDTWVYIPERDVIFGRIHEPKNWSSQMVPDGRTSLCLEIFCGEGDEIWDLPGEELYRRCALDLERLGFIKADEVVDGSDLKVKNAYPVFLVGYRDVLDATFRRLSEYDGIHLVGRTGAFTYTNMDQVIHDALTLVGRLIAEPVDGPVDGP